MGQQLVGITVFMTLFSVFGITPVIAESPGITTIVENMKDVFEPERPRIGEVTISVSGEDDQPIEWTGRQVRKTLPDGKQTLLVMLAPQDVRGSAFLVKERENQFDAMWIYLPAIDRVRQIVPVESYQRFLETDFTYADLGFVGREGKYRLLGEEAHAGTQAYKVEFVPHEPWYYSRIVTWVATDTFIPLRREYYDAAGKLWKTQTFENVTLINDIPTPLRITMHDVQQDTTTEFTMKEVRYDAEIPDALFDPTQLPAVATRPL